MITSMFWFNIGFVCGIVLANELLKNRRRIK